MGASISSALSTRASMSFDYLTSLKFNGLKLPSLPEDIIIDILSRLPVKSLVRFKCVSKSWIYMIESPEFVKLHRNRTILDIGRTSRKRVLLSIFPGKVLMCEDLDDVEVLDVGAKDNEVVEVSSPYESSEITYDIDLVDKVVVVGHPPQFLDEEPYYDIDREYFVGSCNGLVCYMLEIRDRRTFFIWNPSTRMYRRFSEDDVEVDSYHSVFAVRHYDDAVLEEMYGFGYDSSEDAYKVVRLSRYSSTPFTTKEVTVEVLSIGKSRWRKTKDEILADLPYETGRFAYGALHWLIEDNYSLGKTEPWILSFNLEKEKCEEVIPLPHVKKDIRFTQLVVVDGLLAVLGKHGELCGTGDIDFMVFEESKGRSSWTKKVTLTLQSIPSPFPVCFLKDGQLLVTQSRRDGEVVSIYDPRDKTYRSVNLHNKLYEWKSAVYVESLVSPY